MRTSYGSLFLVFVSVLFLLSSLCHYVVGADNEVLLDGDVFDIKEREEESNHTEILCNRTAEHEVKCNGTHYEKPEGVVKPPSGEFFIDLFVAIGLIVTAGLMSGLTMGLLSLDTTNLDILRKSGTPNEMKCARLIYPLVSRHHLLLVTLLLCNAAACEALPLFLDKISSRIVAIVVSVTAVLFAGEIIPQALCTRWGLQIGASLFWLVWGLVGLTFIISWPISKLLDFILGHETGTFYRRAELKELVGMHAKENLLTSDEITIIQGALGMQEKTVADILTPMEKLYMLDVKTKMNRGALEEIFNTGHSRIPVYRDRKTNIIGVLLVKLLILYNEKDEVPLEEIQLRAIPTIPSTTKLYDLLNQFQTGHSHMALVANNDEEIIGVVTMEDVIEELIQEEILDEGDHLKARKISLARVAARANATSPQIASHLQAIKRSLGTQSQSYRASSASPPAYRASSAHPPLPKMKTYDNKEGSIV